MGMFKNSDGTFTYTYELYVKPCPVCHGTKIQLYEIGKDKKSLKGGARCATCLHYVEANKVPDVPSMNMLLEIWNNQ
jgi:hypothetical protein